MNPLVVLSCALAAVSGAPTNYQAAAILPAAAPVAYAQVASVPAPAPYTTQHIAGPDVVSHSQAPAVITKSLTYGSKDFVSGHVSAIHKPAIPDFRIQVPTVLKGTVSHTAPLVKTVKETHVVNEPVPVLKTVEVPYDAPVYKEQIVEVPVAHHQVKHVPVQVPYAVPGKQIVNIKHTAPIVKHTHSHHVAQPAVAYAAHQGGVYAAAPTSAYTLTPQAVINQYN